MKDDFILPTPNKTALKRAEVLGRKLAKGFEAMHPHEFNRAWNPFKLMDGSTPMQAGKQVAGTGRNTITKRKVLK